MVSVNMHIFPAYIDRFSYFNTNKKPSFSYSMQTWQLFIVLSLSVNYCHKTGTRPPSCAKSRQPTIYEKKIG